MKKLSYLLFPLLLAACAKMNYEPRFEKFGHYTDTTALDEKADDLSWAQVKDVQVFIGETPDGIRFMTDEKIEVTQKNKYEVLGKVEVKPKGHTSFWFYDFPEDQDWRNTYCNVQTPFVWMTLGIWNIMPFYYPCWMFDSSNSSRAMNDRRNRVVNTMKKAVKAAGGDTLVVVGFTTQVTTVYSQYGGASSYETDVAGGVGYAVKTLR